MSFVDCVLHCCTFVLTQQLQWLPEDIDNLTRARMRCPQIYKNSPCLTKFTKVEERVYRAICGRNNNE